jgi:hypothetical protein
MTGSMNSRGSRLARASLAAPRTGPSVSRIASKASLLLDSGPLDLAEQARCQLAILDRPVAQELSDRGRRFRVMDRGKFGLDDETFLGQGSFVQ